MFESMYAIIAIMLRCKKNHQFQRFYSLCLKHQFQCSYLAQNVKKQFLLSTKY